MKIGMFKWKYILKFIISVISYCEKIIYFIGIFFSKKIFMILWFLFFIQNSFYYKNKFSLNKIKFLYYRLLIANLLYLLFKQKYIWNRWFKGKNGIIIDNDFKVEKFNLNGKTFIRKYSYYNYRGHFGINFIINIQRVK